MDEFKNDLKALVEQAQSEGVNERDIAKALREAASGLDPETSEPADAEDEPGE